MDSGHSLTKKNLSKFPKIAAYRQGWETYNFQLIFLSYSLIVSCALPQSHLGCQNRHWISISDAARPSVEEEEILVLTAAVTTRERDRRRPSYLFLPEVSNVFVPSCPEAK